MNRPERPSGASPEGSTRGDQLPAPRTIDGRREFEQAFRDAMSHLAAHGSLELWLCDSDFADWPLGERVLVPQFEAWSYSHRRFNMIACHYDAVARQHPRWVAWRRQWAHIVDCRVLPPEIEPSACPSLLVAPGVVTLRLFDPVRYRGVLAFGEGPDEREAFGLADALLQRSEPGFPATTLGL